MNDPDILEAPDRTIPAFDANGLIDPSFGFYPAFEALCRSDPVTCKTSGEVILGLPRPTIAIIDVRAQIDLVVVLVLIPSCRRQPFAGCDMKVVRSIAPPKDLVVFAWVSGPVNGTMREFCPRHLGGRSDVWEKAE